MMFEINPLDQPNINRRKNKTFKVIKRFLFCPSFSPTNLQYYYSIDVSA